MVNNNIPTHLSLDVAILYHDIFSPSVTTASCKLFVSVSKLHFTHCFASSICQIFTCIFKAEKGVSAGLII
ncbi:hypothetical protein C5F61_13225 [Photobacterium damselae subsp. damselae]|nr:hypothetical protein C5F61_13225 [Photobacterium damselae subsp. damselae]